VHQWIKKGVGQGMNHSIIQIFFYLASKMHFLNCLDIKEL